MVYFLLLREVNIAGYCKEKGYHNKKEPLPFSKTWDELKFVRLLCLDLPIANTVMTVKVIQIALFHVPGAEIVTLGLLIVGKFLCTSDSIFKS